MHVPLDCVISMSSSYIRTVNEQIKLFNDGWPYLILVLSPIVELCSGIPYIWQLFLQARSLHLRLVWNVCYSIIFYSLSGFSFLVLLLTRFLMLAANSFSFQLHALCFLIIFSFFLCFFSHKIMLYLFCYPNTFWFLSCLFIYHWCFEFFCFKLNFWN